MKRALDPKSRVLTEWLPTVAAYCNWIHVVCDSAGNVAQLSLSFVGADGTLPPPAALSDLPRLQVCTWKAACGPAGFRTACVRRLAGRAGRRYRPRVCIPTALCC